MGQLPICVYSQWGYYICYVESTLRSKGMLLGHKKCYPRAQTLPNSTELLSIISLKAQPPLGSLCMLALFISCHCSGPCADANYSNADRRSVYSCVSCCVQIWKSGFPAKAPRSHRKGETLKLPSYRLNDGSWALPALSKNMHTISSTLWHPLQQSDCSTSQVPFCP